MPRTEANDANLLPFRREIKVVQQNTNLNEIFPGIPKNPDRQEAFNVWESIKQDIRSTTTQPDLLDRDIGITEEWLSDLFHLYTAPQENIGFGTVLAFATKYYATAEPTQYANIFQKGKEYDQSSSNEFLTSAFIVHTRDDYEVGDYDDLGNCTPALKVEHGANRKKAHRLWQYLPPVPVGVFYGNLPDGTNIRMIELSAQISLPILEELGEKSTSNKLLYARERIDTAVTYAERLGAEVIGLAEVNASLVHHGRILEKTHPDSKIVTGHRGTVAAIKEYVYQAAIENGAKYQSEESEGFSGQVDLSNQTITIIGCGSIGSATAESLAEEVAGFKLHDIDPKRASILEGKLKEKYPRLPIKVFKPEDLPAACANSAIVVSAITQAGVLTADLFDDNTIIIDDSQPRAVSKIDTIALQERGGIVVGPRFKMPLGLIRIGMDYGTDDIYGCHMETMSVQVPPDTALATSGIIPILVETTGPATVDGVKAFREISHSVSFVPGWQAFSDKPHKCNTSGFTKEASRVAKGMRTLLR